MPRRTPNRTPSNKLDFGLDNQVSGAQTQVPTVSDALQSTRYNAYLPVSPGNTKPSDDFSIDVPESFSATDTGFTPADVFSARSQAEAEVTPQPDVLGDIETNVNEPQNTVLFDDVNGFINTALFGDDEPSEAEKTQQKILDDYAKRVEEIQSNLNITETQARDEFSLAQKERDLSETNTRIAEKTTALRRELRAFDADAERRGLVRSAFQNERQAIESRARAELADEYIIQAAQEGNLTRAEGLVKTAVDNRIQAFELRNQADQAKLDALIPTLEGEEKLKAQQLALALQIRSEDIATQKAEQEGIRNMMVTAAQNGADGRTLQQILASSSVDKAMALAGPYIGYYDRLQVQSTLANAALSRRKTLVDLALAGDENAMAQLGSFGESLKAQLEQTETEEQYETYKQVIDNAFTIQEKANIADRIANSPALGAATGTYQNNFFANVLGGAAGGTALGTIAGPIGMGGGAVLGAGTGWARYNAIERQREDLFDDIGALTSKETLQTLIDAKAKGATFGALSNQELGLLVQASNALSSKVITSPETGKIVGISGTEDSVKRAIDEVVKYYQKAEMENFSNMLSTEERASIIGL